MILLNKLWENNALRYSNVKRLFCSATARSIHEEPQVFSDISCEQSYRIAIWYLRINIGNGNREMICHVGIRNVCTYLTLVVHLWCHQSFIFCEIAPLVNKYDTKRWVILWRCQQYNTQYPSRIMDSVRVLLLLSPVASFTNMDLL